MVTGTACHCGEWFRAYSIRALERHRLRVELLTFELGKDHGPTGTGHIIQAERQIDGDTIANEP